jgi:hypothetical protein
LSHRQSCVRQEQSNNEKRISVATDDNEDRVLDLVDISWADEVRILMWSCIKPVFVHNSDVDVVLDNGTEIDIELFSVKHNLLFIDLFAEVSD